MVVKRGGGVRKLPDTVVLDARRRYAAGQTQEAVRDWIKDEQGIAVSVATIRNALTGKTYRDVGDGNED